MTPEKIWIAAFILLGVFVLSGCGQTVQFYSGPELPGDKIATFLIPDNQTELILDGKFVEWNRHGHLQEEKVLFGVDDVYVKMLPGLHEIEWSLSRPNESWTYRGNGTLDTQSGRNYEIHFQYLPGRTELIYWEVDVYREKKLEKVEVKDYATWITDRKTGAVVVGNKPLWAK